MKRHLLRPLLWSVLLLICGLVDLLRFALRVFAKLGFKGVFVLAALVAAARSGSLLAAQLPFDAVRPLGYGIAAWAYATAATVVVAFGFRSRVRRHLWARLAWRLRLSR